MNTKFIGHLNDQSNVLFWGGAETSITDVEEVFKFPTIGKERKFETDYSLDSDEWFFIELNKKEKESMIGGYLSVLSSSVDFNTITPKQYDRLIALYLIKEKSEGVQDIIFNRIFDRYCIQSKILFSFDVSGPKINKVVNAVEFNHSVDAFWNDANKKLYFRKYSTIKPLFLGIEKYYRSATKDEVSIFLKNDFFSVSDDFPATKLGERALHNIAAILDSNEIDFSDSDVRKSYVNYANDFEAFDVHIEDGKFKVEKPTDLTKILSVLQERLYISPVTKQKRVASNTSPID